MWPFTRRATERKASDVGRLLAMFSVGQPKWTPRKYDSFAKEGYQQNVIAFRCISLIAKGKASVPWLLYKGKNEVEDESHPLLKLLKKPNPQQGGADLFEALYSFDLIAGNTYMEAVGPMNGPPIELYAHRPDRIKVIPSEVGTPRAFSYTVNGTLTKLWEMNPITGDGPILHIKRFNPLDDWYGMSPVEAAAYGIDQHNAAGAWNKALLDNSARPSGALVYAPKEGSGNLSEEAFQRLKQQLVEQQQAADAKGTPLFLDGGLDWKEMAMSPKDMDWLKGRDMSARDICAAFGVPPMLVGVPGEATFANYKEARMGFWEDTVLPSLDQHIDALNNWLVPKFGDNLRLSYDEDAISALSPKREELWKRVEAASFLSMNERREAVGYGRLDNPDADEPMVPSTSLPLGFKPEPVAGDPKAKSKEAYGE